MAKAKKSVKKKVKKLGITIVPQPVAQLGKAGGSRWKT
jgi:hypothetical protein